MISTYSILSLLILVLDIYAIFLVLTSSASVAWKLIWILLILFLPVVGMLLYFLLGRGGTMVRG